MHLKFGNVNSKLFKTIVVPGVLGAIARAHGFRITRVVLYLREELLIVLGTSSSETVAPRA